MKHRKLTNWTSSKLKASYSPGNILRKYKDKPQAGRNTFKIMFLVKDLIPEYPQNSYESLFFLKKRPIFLNGPKILTPRT